MSTVELVDKELAELPEPLQSEVYDFARFLRVRQQDERFDGLLLSQSVLAKDWNTPEEDTAWTEMTKPYAGIVEAGCVGSVSNLKP